MKGTKRITTQNIENLYHTIKNFFHYNIALVSFGVLLISYVTYSSNSTFQSEALERMDKQILFLKQNIGKVHFLTAGGQHIVGDRYSMGHSDEKFKYYIQNLVVDNLVQGKSDITGGFNKEIRIKNGKDLFTKNAKIKFFKDNFIEKRSPILNKYVKSTYLAMVEKRLPEYILPTNVKYKLYTVSKGYTNQEGSHNTTIDGVINIRAFVKSFIKEYNQWDTREVETDISFKIEIEIEKYANIANPFGVRFESVTIPIILKPLASSIKRKDR